MALTYRTGSDGKGSALTINELDNNFRYFTGSHSINGDLTITGSILVSGSENSIFDGPIVINNLPTAEPTTSGQLWLSGSFSNSKYLMVRD
tara:strand:+ start:603 stop:875 length:273 start_codon:yes stop_codon:yes gene_type:complete